MLQKLKQCVATFVSSIVIVVTLVGMQLIGLLNSPKKFFGAGPIN